MANVRYFTNKKGELTARIQALGKDIKTGNRKYYSKTIVNTDHLCESKFKKLIQKESYDFDEEVANIYEDAVLNKHTRVLTFKELSEEFINTVDQNFSKAYLRNVNYVVDRFNNYLSKNKLTKNPISDITVRDIQMFINSFEQGIPDSETAVLKKDLPEDANLRQLSRERIIYRSESYKMTANKKPIPKKQAKSICKRLKISYKEYFDELPIKKYSTETIRKHRRVLCTIFNEALRYGWITLNPVTLTKIPNAGKGLNLNPIKEKDVYSIAECKELIKYLDNVDEEFRYRAFVIKFILLTGVRKEEMCGLKWCDIDLERKVVHICRARLYEGHKYGYIEKETKTKTSVRDIPLPKNLIEDIQKQIEWYKEGVSDFDDRLDELYVATNEFREAMYYSSPLHWLNKFQKEGGFKHVTIHGLRHTYCSILLSQNVPIQTVSKYMGHSDSTITLQVYSHFIPDTENLVIDAISNILK